MKTQRNIRPYWMGIVLLIGMGFWISSCNLLPGAASNSSATAVPVVTADPSVSAEGHLVPRDSATLVFFTGGKIAEIPVKEGDVVKKGTVLMRMGDREQAQAAVASASLEQLNARQALDDLKEKSDLGEGKAQQALAAAQKAVYDAQKIVDDLNTDDYQQELDDDWIAVTDAQDELKDAQDDLDKYQDLDSDNQTRKDAQQKVDDAQKKLNETQRTYGLWKNQLDEANANLALAKAQLSDAQREFDNRKNGPDPDDLALAQSQYDNATATLTAAQAALANLDLTAPYDGTVVEIRTSTNEAVAPNQPVIVFADFSTWYVETSDLTEMDVVDIHPEQKVTIVPDSIHDLILTGSVESIANSAKDKAGDVVYTVRIKLEKPDSRLRWGMTVNTTFKKD